MEQIRLLVEQGKVRAGEMKKPTQVTLAVTIIAFAAVTCVLAAIEPLVITLTASSKSYTVPSGKVLVIENGYSGNDFSTGQAILLMNGMLTNVVYVDNWFKEITPIQPSLKLTENWTVEARLEPTDDHFIMLFCLLVDPEDLYAAMESEFDFAAAAGTDFQAILKAAGPRQARIQVERSVDLVDWEEAMQASVAPAESKTDHRVSVPHDLNVEAIRAWAFSRTVSGGIKRN